MENGADPSVDGQVPIDSIIRAALDQAAEQRSEDDGMPEHVQKAADPQAWEAGRVERNRSPETSVPTPLPGVAVSEAPMALREEVAHGRDENTDLERRMLAHERILQALIAHMSETEPKFLARLDATFREPMRLSRCEHDYTDTDAYAERFIHEVIRLTKTPLAPMARREAPHHPLVAAAPMDSVALVGTGSPILIQIKYRTGVWEVTKNGRFYSDYFTKEWAQKAVQDAVDAIASKGGSAVVSYVGSRTGQG